MRLFEPAAITPGPSGLADWPRPFVFRAMHLDGQTFSPGQPFHFDLNLFDTGLQAISYLTLTFAQLAREGLGPARSKVELVTVARLNEFGDPCAIIYLNGCFHALHKPPLALDLSPTSEFVRAFSSAS